MYVVAIVDGFNAARFFPIRLSARGIPCIHITTKNLKDRYFDKSHYLENFFDTGNTELLCQQITDHYSLNAVIPGSESGVNIAHEIAEKYQLRRNKDFLKPARRNKWEMGEAVNRYGLKTAKQFKSDCVDNILVWRKANITYPVVVKPIDSAGSDHVFICSDDCDLVEKLNTTFENANLYGEPIKEVLIQEFLEGIEYVVNLISYEGKHFVIELRQYHKQTINGRYLYDFEELIDFDGAIQRELIDYAKQVATAVGIQYGPSHIELIMTNEGPKLVEIGARISGATNVGVSNEALGYNAVDLTIDSYLNDIKLINNQIKKKEAIVDIATSARGVIKAIPFKEALKHCDSIKSCVFKVNIGDTITPTISLPTSPVKIHLVAESVEKIYADIRYLKEAAKEGFVV